MKTLSERALELAKAKQENAWQRACKATHPGAKNYWTSENNRLAELVIKIGYRIEAAELAVVVDSCYGCGHAFQHCAADGERFCSEVCHDRWCARSRCVVSVEADGEPIPL